MEIIVLLVIGVLAWLYADYMVKRAYVTTEDRLEILTWALVFLATVSTLVFLYGGAKAIYQIHNENPKGGVVATPLSGKYNIQCTATGIEITKE